MESIQDSFNFKIISLERMRARLVNLYEEFENERKSILSEAITIKRTAKEDLTEMCEITKVILENLKIDINSNKKIISPNS